MVRCSNFSEHVLLRALIIIFILVSVQQFDIIMCPKSKLASITCVQEMVIVTGFGSKYIQDFVCNHIIMHPGL